MYMCIGARAARSLTAIMQGRVGGPVILPEGEVEVPLPQHTRRRRHRAVETVSLRESVQAGEVGVVEPLALAVEVVAAMPEELGAVLDLVVVEDAVALVVEGDEAAVAPGVGPLLLRHPLPLRPAIHCVCVRERV